MDLNLISEDHAGESNLDVYVCVYTHTHVNKCNAVFLGVHIMVLLIYSHTKCLFENNKTDLESYRLCQR